MSDETKRAAEIQCPICGYYCLGKGGVGCIDKPSAQPIEGDGEGEATLTVKLFKAIAYPLVNAIGDISITECLDAIDRQLDQAVRNANR